LFLLLVVSLKRPATDLPDGTVKHTQLALASRRHC
jgi:hypothetical protein